MTSPYAHSKVFRALWSKGLFGVMEIFSILAGMVSIWLKPLSKFIEYISVNLTSKTKKQESCGTLGENKANKG